MDAKTLCLAALSLETEASGYEIKKKLDEPPFNHFQDTGFGSIYPALTRLAEEGLIEGTAQAQAKRPDKKVFRLTEAGRERLSAALLESPAPDRFRSDFFFLLFMSDAIPRDHLARLIDQRIADYDRLLAHMANCEAEIRMQGHRFVFELGRTYYGTLRQFLAENRDRLLKGEMPQEGGTASDRLVAE